MGDEGLATFEEVPEATLGDLGRLLVGRGATYADVDADGDLDILITQTGRAPLLFRNDQNQNHNWLRVRLQSGDRNRHAIGAWIELEVSGVKQRRQVMPTRSYLSQVELPVTFGLGKQTRIDALRIEWPDGSRQEVTPVPEPNQGVTIRQ